MMMRVDLNSIIGYIIGKMQADVDADAGGGMEVEWRVGGKRQ
jgi:hypothetical protein